MKTNFSIPKLLLTVLLLSISFLSKAQTQDQFSNATGAGYTQRDIGQSFVSGVAGTFNSIQLQFRSSQTAVSGLTFYLYAGNTVSGTPIFSKAIPSVPAGGGLITVTFDKLIASTAGSAYAWRLIDDGAAGNLLLPESSGSNPYPNGDYFGQESPCLVCDLWFKTFIDEQTPAPTATAIQTFCQSGIIADLQHNGVNIKWYTAQTAGTELASNTPLVNNTTYYASQTFQGLESVPRTAVTALLNTAITPPPAITTPQNIIAGSTFVNLTGIAPTVKWYANPTAGAPLPATTTLVDGLTYYATQVSNTCESIDRTAVVFNFLPPIESSALHFDGTNDNVSLPVSIANDLSNGTELTIEYWFKGTNVQSAVRMQSGNSYIVAGWMAGTGTPQFLISTDGGVNGVYCGSAASINDNNWHHVACVWKKNTTFATYLDGVLQNSRKAADLNLPVFSNAITFLGSFNGADEFLNGSLDEVRIWNRALSGCEINANKNCELSAVQNNLLAYYKFNNGLAGGLNTASNTLSDYTGNARTGTLNNFALAIGTTSNWTAPGGIASGTTCAAFVSTTPAPALISPQTLPAGSTSSAVVATGTNIQLYATATGGTSIPATTILLNATTYYASQTINDCESSTRTAVLVNLGPSLPAAALNFDGVNDAVTLPIFNFGGDKLTIEAWIKPSGFAYATAEIARQSGQAIRGGTLIDRNYNYRLGFDSNGASLSFGLATSTSAYDLLSIPAANYGVNFLDGNWHHVVAVYDGVNRSIYIDGILKGTNAKTGNILSAGLRNTIGNSITNGTTPFAGNIDEVRFWTKALTACDINTNKNCELPAGQSNLFAYYKFNSGEANIINTTVTAAEDSSENSRTGTLIGFALTSSAASNWTAPGGVITGTSCGISGLQTTQTFCNQATVGDLVVTGQGIQWYNTATAGSGLLPTTVLQTGSYFVGQSIGTCESATRTEVQVNISTTTWASNAWSNGEPDSTKAAIFMSDFTATTNLTACSVSVSGTANVVFPSDFNLTVSNEVMVYASSTLTFENNSNLIQVNAATNTGNIVYKRNAQINRLDYVYWSSPVANQNLLAFTPNTLPNRFYTYNEPTKTFVQVASPATTNFDLAKGYSLRAPNNFVQAPAAAQTFVGIYTGVPNNGNVSVPVTFTASPTGGIGFNLIGNPYPSTVNATQFLNANAGSLYFWTHQSYYNASNVLVNGGVNNYATFNLSGAVAASVTNGVNVAPNGFIQAGQGFMFLTASNKNVTFTNTMRTADAGQFFRTTQTAENDKLWLNLTNNNGAFSQTMVAYLPSTTTGFDDGYDAKQLNTSGTVLSTIGNIGECFSIQSRGPFVNSDVVKLNLNLATAGNYTLSKDNINGIFSNNQDFFLKDNLLGTTHNIKQSPYNFVANAGATANRFEIVYESALSNQNNVFDDNNVIVFEQNGLLNISANDDLKAVKVFDVQGRNIFEAKNIDSKATTLNGFRPQQQVLLLQITNVNNEFVTKKVVF